MKSYLRSNPMFMGMGVPNRSSSYILGYSPKKNKIDNEGKNIKRKNY